MIHRCLSAAAAIVAVLIGVTHLCAQSTQRDKAWLSFALNYSSANSRGTYFGSNAPDAGGVTLGTSGLPGASVAAGFTVSDQVRIGAQLAEWSNLATGGATVTDVAAVTRIYLVSIGLHPVRSPFLILGPLVSFYLAQYFPAGQRNCEATPDPGCGNPLAPPYSSQPTSGNGWGIVAGIGYDVPIASRTMLTTTLSYLYRDLGTITAGGSNLATGWHQSVVMLGMGLTAGRR